MAIILHENARVSIVFLFQNMNTTKAFLFLIDQITQGIRQFLKPGPGNKTIKSDDLSIKVASICSNDLYNLTLVTNHGTFLIANLGNVSTSKENGCGIVFLEVLNTTHHLSLEYMFRILQYS